MTSFCIGICILLIVTGGQFMPFVVKVIWEDFAWFILIFHLSHHSYRRSRWHWSYWDASAGSLFFARRAVSPANVAIVVLLIVGKSAVYSRYNNGPSTLPRGTPDFASLYLE
jgi:hypothetical protein